MADSNGLKVGTKRKPRRTFKTKEASGSPDRGDVVEHTPEKGSDATQFTPMWNMNI